MLKYSWSVALLKGQVIKMSVVIIGGNERMEQQYKQICKKHKCKAKVFTRMSGNLKPQIGQPDLIILLRIERSRALQYPRGACTFQ